jgi:2-polyprenyl-6-methoxyphenol hydroxylase-like FAD-dependent oxidoreductase
MTAAELAAAGVQVTVLEKRGEPALSRAGVLQPRVMEIFAMRGLAQEVLERAQAVNGDRYRTAKGIWAGLPGINYELLDSDFPYIVILSQLEVERLLAERCQTLGVTLLRNVEVVGVAQDATGVDVRARLQGAERTFRAEFVVGADGSRSVVRESAGISWVGHGARNLAVNVDAEVPFPFEDPSVVVNTERGWGLSYPLKKNYTRLAVIDAETMIGVDRDTKIDDAAAVESVRRVFGDDFGVTQARVSQFHDAMFRAGSLRRGRVLLVGESVRVHYPASGVGMNFCLQDAFNLAWKVAASLQGWGQPDVLDTYETERGREVDALLNSVRVQTGIQFSFTRESLALKQFLAEELLKITEVQNLIARQLSGISAHYGDGTTIAGARMPNVGLRDGGSLYEAMRPATYVLLEPTAADPQAGGATRGHAHLQVHALQDDVREYGEHSVLVRPDGHIAAVGEPSAIASALAEARLA